MGRWWSGVGRRARLRTGNGSEGVLVAERSSERTWTNQQRQNRGRQWRGARRRREPLQGPRDERAVVRDSTRPEPDSLMYWSMSRFCWLCTKAQEDAIVRKAVHTKTRAYGNCWLSTDSSQVRAIATAIALRHLPSPVAHRHERFQWLHIPYPCLPLILTSPGCRNSLPLVP